MLAIYGDPSTTSQVDELHRMQEVTTSYTRGNYIVCKSFVVQTFLWWVEFLIHHKSRARHNRSFKLEVSHDKKYDFKLSRFSVIPSAWQNITYIYVYLVIPVYLCLKSKYYNIYKNISTTIWVCIRKLDYFGGNFGPIIFFTQPFSN